LASMQYAVEAADEQFLKKLNWRQQVLLSPVCIYITATTMRRTGRRLPAVMISLGPNSQLLLRFSLEPFVLASHFLGWGSYFYQNLFQSPFKGRPIFDMIHLRPSEITLTPADVEETRCRIEHKHAALPSATRSTRVPRPHTRPIPGPRVRRGPEHSRDDAITRLGDIPVLRPHQVVHVSVDSDPGDQQAVSPNHQSESSFNNGPAEQTAAAPSNNATEPSTGYRMQLPFRPAPAHPNSEERIEEDLSTSPPSRNPFGYSGFCRQRTNTSEETTEGPAQSRLSTSTDGINEAPSTSLVSGRSRVRSVRQHSTHAPFPLHQTHEVNLPHDSHGRNDTPMRAPSRMYLQGYFASPEEYTFREYPTMPRTEPRPRSERPVHMIRTISSNSDPSLSALVHRANQPQPSSMTEDVFWTPLSTILAQREASDSVDGTERDRRRPLLEERIRSGSQHITEFVQDRYRGLFGGGRAAQPESSRLDVSRRTSQRFSEASSNSSLPYSFYELPLSQQSSSTHSQGSQLPQSQYDGAAPSRDVSRGVYFSIRPSQVPLRPPTVRVSSFSSPNLTVAPSQHGMSPSPASPYSHGPRGSPRHHHQQSLADSSVHLGPLTGLVSSRDFVGEDRDAASAAQRDLSSPLELLEQRAYSYLPRISTAVHTVSSSSQQSSEGPSAFRYQVTDFAQQQQQRRSRRPSGEDSTRQSSGHSTRSRTTTSRRYPATTRIAQRSSENVPVGTQVTLGSIQNAPSLYRGNLRGGDMSSSPIPLRFSMPQYPRPRDMSNRSQLQPPYQRGHSVRSPHGSERTISPPESFNTAQLQELYTRTQDLEREHNPFYSSSPASPFEGRRVVSQRHEQTPPLRHQRSIPPEDIPHHGSSRRAPAGARTYPERPERSSLAPTLGQGAGRRPEITHVPISRRRITPQQQNQENSGEAEDERMRAEMVAAGMRYEVDGQQLDVMDETPPRLGRFERAALG
jgi:hypothetical protein